MKAELEQFKKDIRTYDRDQLFSLCVELKEFSIRQSVVLKEYKNSFPVMTKDYQSLKAKLKQKTEELPEYQAIRFISEIYRKENPLRDLSPEERLERRQKEVKPEVDAFFEFVHQFSLEDPLVSEKQLR